MPSQHLSQKISHKWPNYNPSHQQTSHGWKISKWHVTSNHKQKCFHSVFSSLLPNIKQFHKQINLLQTISSAFLSVYKFPKILAYLFKFNPSEYDYRPSYFNHEPGFCRLFSDLEDIPIQMTHHWNPLIKQFRKISKLTGSHERPMN